MILVINIKELCHWKTEFTSFRRYSPIRKENIGTKNGKVIQDTLNEWQRNSNNGSGIPTKKEYIEARNEILSVFNNDYYY